MTREEENKHFLTTTPGHLNLNSSFVPVGVGGGGGGGICQLALKSPNIPGGRPPGGMNTTGID